MSTTAAAVEVQRRKQREKEKQRRQQSPAPQKKKGVLGKAGGTRLGKGGPRIEPAAGGDEELGQEGATSSRDFQTPTGAVTSYEDTVEEAKRRRRITKTMNPKDMDRWQVFPLPSRNTCRVRNAVAARALLHSRRHGALLK